jgi:hypothetical protein
MMSLCRMMLLWRMMSLSQMTPDAAADDAMTAGTL